MILRFPLMLAGAAVMAAAQLFAAEPVVRVKAKLVAFDGQVMRLEPLSKATSAAEAFSVSVTPGTRYVGAGKASFADIKAGGYAGAAVEARGSGLRAQEVYLYADALRGSGEGRFSEGGRLMVNGTVTAVKPSAPEDTQDGIFTLHYRAATLNGTGGKGPVCEGRASPPAFASALACEADATVEVKPGTPISVLTVGDKSLLQPGVLVTVAMTKGPEGKEAGSNVALGVVVEKPPAAAVEKSPSSP